MFHIYFNAIMQVTGNLLHELRLLYTTVIVIGVSILYDICHQKSSNDYKVDIVVVIVVVVLCLFVCCCVVVVVLCVWGGGRGGSVIHLLLNILTVTCFVSCSIRTQLFNTYRYFTWKCGEVEVSYIILYHRSSYRTIVDTTVF